MTTQRRHLYRAIGQRDFTVETNGLLLKRGYIIVGVQRMPADMEDAYALSDSVGRSFFRFPAEVRELAEQGTGAPDWSVLDG